LANGFGYSFPCPRYQNIKKLLVSWCIIGAHILVDLNLLSEGRNMEPWNEEVSSLGLGDGSIVPVLWFVM
jgi:hypothetical protein